MWRIRPFFGPTAGDLQCALRSTVLYPGAPAGLRDHFLARAGGGGEEVFFPDDRAVLGNGNFVSDKFRMYNVHPASHFNGRVLHFTVNVAGGPLPAARRTLNWMGRSNHRTQLFRWEAGVGAHLLRDEEIFRVDAPPSVGGCMTMTRRPVSGLHPTEFDLFRGAGAPERRLVFDRGLVSEFSVSNNFGALVLLGAQQYAFAGGGEWSCWVHRPGMPEAIDLQVPGTPAR